MKIQVYSDEFIEKVVAEVVSEEKRGAFLYFISLLQKGEDHVVEEAIVFGLCGLNELEVGEHVVTICTEERRGLAKRVIQYLKGKYINRSE